MMIYKKFLYNYKFNNIKRKKLIIKLIYNNYYYSIDLL